MENRKTDTKNIVPNAPSTAREASAAMQRLLDIMAALRTPETGCPWDLAQNFKSVAPHTIEEACEVVDAIERDNMADLREELGDLLFQVVFHAQLAAEAGLFDFQDIVQGVTEKMIRRHPHVFIAKDPDGRAKRIDGLTGTTGTVDMTGSETNRPARVSDSGLKRQARHNQSWDAIKAAEKQTKTKKTDSEEQADSLMADIPLTLSALSRAVKIQKRAAKTGFDWPTLMPLLDKIQEEIDEVRAEIKNRPDSLHVQAEIGDVLFALVNLARYLDCDPEQALRGTNDRFIRRFRWMEQNGKNKLDELTLDELETLWQQAKKQVG